MSAPVFSRKAARIVIGVTAVSFLAALLLTVFGPELTSVQSYEPDSYSYSSVGHGALVETLQELDIPVLVSAWKSGRRAGKQGVLLLLEPRLSEVLEDGWTDELTSDDFLATFEGAKACLLVLSKWNVTPGGEKRGWADDATAKSASAVLAPLRAVECPAELVRPDHTDAWRTNEFGAPPQLDTPQLLRSELLDPVIACDQGILLGEMKFGDTRVLVLSDPDVISNYGMRKGENAVLAVRVIEHLRRGGAAVVDETLHGYYFEPSIWRGLFRFPLSLVIAHVVLWLLVMLWAALGRFGSPQREVPPLEPGNRFLIRNTAELLRFGGHKGHVVERYLADSVREVATKLHAPKGVRGQALMSWVAQMDKARGVQRPLAGFADPKSVALAGEERAVALAVQIHEWKQEILDEPRSGS